MTLAFYGKSKKRRLTLALAALFGVMVAVAMGTVFSPGQQASAATSTFQEGTAPTGTCASPGSALSSNNSDSACEDGENLVAGGFGLNAVSVLPAGNVPTGFIVRIEGETSNDQGTDQMNVELSWNGGTNWTTPLVATNDFTDNGDTEVFAGGSQTCHAFNRTWSASELTDANFRVRATANSDPSTIDVDDIDVALCYFATSEVITVHLKKELTGPTNPNPVPTFSADLVVPGSGSANDQSNIGFGTSGTTVISADGSSGQWTVAEDAVANYDVTGVKVLAGNVQCSSGGVYTDVDFGQTFNIGDLAGGNVVTVCFRNEYIPPPPALTIRKVVSPDAAAANFTADVTGTGPDFLNVSFNTTGTAVAVTGNNLDLTVTEDAPGANWATTGWYVDTTAPLACPSFTSGDWLGDEHANVNLAASRTATVSNLDADNGEAALVCFRNNYVAPNIALGNTCGFDIALVLDRSSSIDAAEWAQVTSAANAFVTALANTPSTFAVFSFGTNGTVELGTYTAVGNGSAITTVINNIATPGTQGTNWEDGLLVVTAPPVDTKQDLVVVITDGNPTYYNDPAGVVGAGAVAGPGNTTTFETLTDGIMAANQQKNLGRRMIAVGVGGGVDTDNLNFISSADGTFVGDFATLTQTLQNLATQLCGGTINVQKVIDPLVGAPTNAGAGWNFTPGNVAGGTVNPAVMTPTGPGGNVTFKTTPSVQGGQTTLSITENAPFPLAGYTLTSITCTKNGNPIGTPNIANSQVTGLSVGANETINCTFLNTEQPQTRTIDVKKVRVGGGTTAVTFSGTLNPGGTAAADDAWSVATTGATTAAGVGPDSNTVSTSVQTVDETAVNVGALSNWTTEWRRIPGTGAACDSTAGGATAYAAGTSASVPADTNNYTVCFRNTLKAASINIEKTPDNQQILVNGTATFTITLTNSGLLPLTNVTVADALSPNCDRTWVQIQALSLIPGPGTVGPSFDPGESASYQCTRTNVAADFTNSATATGTPPVGPNVTDTDTAAVDVTAPSINIEKTPDNQQVVSGGTATFTITVTNNGDVALTNVTVTDALSPSCDRTWVAIQALNLVPGPGTVGASFDPGETFSYQCTATNVLADFTNSATATGTPPVGPNVSDTDTALVDVTAPGITIVKSTNGQDANAAPGPSILVGSPVAWTYLVTNTGDVTLTNISVTDDQGVAVSCPKTILAPGESMICTGNGTAVAGQYSNIGTATGTPPVGSNVSDTDPSHYLGVQPNVTPVKAVTQQSIQPGGTINYALSVNNTGTAAAPIGTVTVTDLAPAGTTLNVASITPAAGWSCSAIAANTTVSCTNTAVVAIGNNIPVVTFSVTHTATGDALCRQIDNTAQLLVVGAAPINSNQVSTTITCTPNVTPVKAVTQQSIAPGGTINYALSVNNTGTAVAPIGTVTVTDLAPSGTSLNLGSVTAAAGWDCSASAGQTVSCTNTAVVAIGNNIPVVTFSVAHTATGADLCLTINNTAQIGQLNSNQVSTTITCTPNVTPSKAVTQQSIQPGGVINYTISVSNNGTAAAAAGTVIVTDSAPTGTTMNAGSVVASAGWDCSASAGQNVSCTNTAPVAVGGPFQVVTFAVTHTATETFLCLPITNTAQLAIVGAAPINSNEVTTSILCAPDVNVTKVLGPNQGNTVELGLTVTYVITVTNNGTATETDILVKDTLTGNHAGVISVTVNPNIACTPANLVGAGCIIPSLGAGQSVVYTVVVQASRETCGPINNSVAISKAQFPDLRALPSSADAPTVQVGPCLDIEKTSATPIVNAGTPFTYTVTVTNTSQVGSGPLLVVDDVPLGLINVSASGSGWTCSTPPPVNGSNTITCTHPGVAAGQPIPVITVTATGTPIDGVCRPVTNWVYLNPLFAQDLGARTHLDISALASDWEDTDIRCEPNITIDKQGPAVAQQGTQITYDIVVSNTGNANSGPLVVTDTLPAGVTAVLPLPSDCSINGQVITCDIFNGIPAGQSVTITIKVQLPANVCGPIVNTAVVELGDLRQQVKSLVTGRIISVSSDSVTTNVEGCMPDLTVVKTGPASVANGGQMNYTFVVTNSGNGPANPPIVVTDTLATSLVYNGFAGVNWNCIFDNGTRVLTCTYNAVIAPGANSTQLSITVTVNEPNCADITNVASVIGGLDTTPSQSNTVVTDVTGCEPDLTLDKQGPASANQGGAIAYTLTVGNNGPVPTSGTITVTDTLPAGVAFVSASGPNWVCNQAAGVVTCTTDQVIPAGGTSTVITINVTAPAGVCSPLLNRAVASGGGDSGADPDATDQVETTINGCAPTIDITKTASTTSVNAGSQFSYLITVTNNGSAPATNVVVTDTFTGPANIVSISPNPGIGGCTIALLTSTGCVIPSINPGQSYQITVIVATTAGQCGVANNSATAAIPGGASDTANADPVDIINCDVPQATITVIKNYTAAHGAADIPTVTINGNANPNQQDGAQTTWSQSVPVGQQIPVVEVPASGWQPVGNPTFQGCQLIANTQTTATVVVPNAGGNCTITFTNQPVAFVQLIKSVPGVIPGDAAWQFNSTLPAFTTSLPHTGGQTASIPVNPGNYSVTELLANSFTCNSSELPITTFQVMVGGVAHSNGNVTGPVAFPAQQGQTTTVAFTNSCGAVAAPASLIVRKFNDPKGDMTGTVGLEDWKITVTGPAFTAELDTDGNGLAFFANVPDGVYQVCEELQSGWQVVGSKLNGAQPLNNQFCRSGVAVSSGQVPLPEVAFYNRGLGQLTVTKETVRNGVGEPLFNGGWIITVTSATCGVTRQGVTTQGLPFGTVSFSDLPACNDYVVSENPNSRAGLSPAFTPGGVTSHTNVAVTVGGTTTRHFLNVRNDPTGCPNCPPPVTNTPVPPTTVPPTNTPVPPTSVPPTNTPVPPTSVPPTNTPVPPTATNTPIDTAAGARTPGPTPIAPSTGTGTTTPAGATNMALALLGLLTVSGGLVLLSLGRKPQR